MNRIPPSTIKSLVLKIFAACLLMFVSLIVPSFVLQYYSVSENPVLNHLVKAIAVGAIVLIGLWLLRSRLDNGAPDKIGLNKPRISTRNFLIGIGFILVPLILTLILSAVFGWGKFSVNTSDTIVQAILLGLISTLFTDALSEELIFRGYIFSNLKEHYSTWVSSFITLAIFVLAPLLLITLQNSLNIEGAVALSGGYVINMVFFGAFMQYLRVIFKSIWVGVGFHLVFVQMNQLMGTTSDRFLQFSENSNQLPFQLTLILFLLILFLTLIIHPIYKRRKEKMLVASVS
jgi:membrane protease YdiL (CAAX protease family)